MIKIQIEGNERNLSEASESWINQQINRRRADGVPVCVRVSIHEGSLNMVLSSSECQESFGGGRSPSPQEKEIFDLWEKHGLKKSDFQGGNLIAFLKQLRKMI